VAPKRSANSCGIYLLLLDLVCHQWVALGGILTWSVDRDLGGIFHTRVKENRYIASVAAMGPIVLSLMH